MNDPDCLQGGATTVAYNLSSISPDEVTLSAATSTDDGQVVEYRFTMLPPIPGGATPAAMSNANQRTMQRLSTLTIPSGVTGTFRIGVEVWDDCGLKSANTSVIAVNIYP